ncbi:MAG: hypothetical protein ACODAJ_00355 [Planctomycetota bacterium]
MNGLIEAAAELQAFLRERGWRFCFIGGIALQRWGEPRVTCDVDATLLTGLGEEERYVEKLLSHFEARRPDAADFALRNRVLLLRAGNGAAIDLALGGFPFEERMVGRASEVDFGSGVRLVLCSAEDLVILKAFAARLQDWADVKRILARQRGHLDWGYIDEQLPPLCELKGEPEIVDRLQDLRNEIANE